MKTNQMMTVNIGTHVFPIGHKDMFGSLTDVWKIGNSYRTKRGLPELDLNHWLRSPETLEYIKVVENDVLAKCAEPAHLERDETVVNSALKTTIQSPLIKAKRGKGGGTWAHLYILLDAAARLDPEFKHQMYKTFVTHKLLQWRDDSGDEFINLNIAIDAYLPGREGKENTGIYINAAKLLKAKLAPEENDWNKASYPKLELRTNIERKLVDFLKMGVVRDWEHLKELIERV